MSNSRNIPHSCKNTWNGNFMVEGPSWLSLIDLLIYFRYANHTTRAWSMLITLQSWYHNGSHICDMSWPWVLHLCGLMQSNIIIYSSAFHKFLHLVEATNVGVNWYMSIPRIVLYLFLYVLTMYFTIYYVSDPYKNDVVRYDSQPECREMQNINFVKLWLKWK